jgi:hypothetical protein
MSIIRIGLAACLCALMVACSGGTTDASTSASQTTQAATSSGGAQPATCAAPLAPSVTNTSIVVPVPSDFDPTSNPTSTTRVYFTVMLPARCPGDHFPLVLQSHGYGGNRLKTLAANGDLHPNDPHFASIVVISYDERGHGDTVPANGGGYARIIDPRAEVQDARAILDWVYDNADSLYVQTEPHSGIPKDVKVGTIGYSYGGGFEMPLAALDARIDTIVPNGTWYDLLYSLLPGDAMKLSYGGLLCLLATTASTANPGGHGVSNTPLVATLCNTIGVQGPAASTVRTKADLFGLAGLPTAYPRPVSGTELTQFFFSHGTGYFEARQRAGLPWNFGETQAVLRKVPALFLQGNRDVLFNATEAYLNARYFAATGADVRVLTTEGGHMNPLAGQSEGTANCGGIIGVASILSWFDKQLKDIHSATFDAIPKVCLSVADTVGAPNTTPVGLMLDSMPVGSLSGAGAVPTVAPTLSASVPLGTTGPVFAPVTTISGSGQVLAGVPRIADLSVARGTGAVQAAVAYVGVGIQRAGRLILVDDQVTPFAEGDHRDDAGLNAGAVLLPAVGQQLQDGDQVGLLFYPQHVQYAAIVSASALPNATNAVNFALGTQIPPVISALNLSTVAVPNVYTVSAAGVELPILMPGTYAGSQLTH